jgi:hypothetical protein
VKVGVYLVVVITGFASVAHAEDPSFAGRLAAGLRTSSTNDSGYYETFDDTSTPRYAAEGLFGVRIGSLVVGVHGGVATPMSFDSVEYFGEGETLPGTTSKIYPIDLGLGVEDDWRYGIWLSGWVGATVAFAHASSPAQFINNIGAYGQVPAISWRYRTTSLGLGLAVGYDITKNEYGRVAVMLGLDSQGIGPISLRDHTGQVLTPEGTQRTTSLTFGLAYAY